MEDGTAPAGLFLSLDQLIKKNTQVRRGHAMVQVQQCSAGLRLVLPTHVCPACRPAPGSTSLVSIPQDRWSLLTQGRQQKGGRGVTAGRSQTGTPVGTRKHVATHLHLSPSPGSGRCRQSCWLGGRL
jgi:hypothetical protein